MITFAKAQVQGRVGQVETKDLEDGKKLGRFSVATEESFKKGDEWDSKTTWVQVVSFNPATVEYIARNVTKGREVHVEGRLRENKWEKDGAKHSTLELHADEIKVGAKVDADGQQEAAE